MYKFIWLSGCCILATAFAATAHAQAPLGGAPGGAGANPAYSPYLNVLRRGNSPGVNYYGLVKPELEFRNAYQGLQQQFANNQLNTTQMSDPRTGLPYTGHTAVFLNTGGYFLNSGAGANQRKLGTAGNLGPPPGPGQTAVPGAQTRRH